MSNDWTPGPWRQSAYDGGWDCVREDSEQGQIIAKLGLNVPANASLIAAAPDLAEALEELVGLVEAAVEGEYTLDSFTAQPGYTALAKARGETPSAESGAEPKLPETETLSSVPDSADGVNKGE